MRWIPVERRMTLKIAAAKAGVAVVFRVGGIHLRPGGMIVLFVLSLIFKGDFLSLLSTQSVGTTGTAVTERDPARDQREQLLVQFVTFVLNDAQRKWSQILRAQGVPYSHAQLPRGIQT
ncbi:MAG TPA: neutral zinc metallopeptidase [Terriglobales bacterium]|nr:neutral zinc metallopeptidase [Terriglobales bacterium]